MENGKWKMENAKAYVFRFPFSVFRFFALFFLLAAYCSLLNAHAQNKYEDRTISNVYIRFENADRDVSNEGPFQIRDISAAEQFRAIARSALGEKYSVVKTRDALQALYDTERIVSVTAQRIESGPASVDLRFIIKRKTQAEKINIVIGNTIGDEVTEQQLLLKLNLLNPGTSITEQTLRNNADLIQAYLRDRGFFNSEVTFAQQPLSSQTEVTVTFRVTPNAQAKVRSFNINVEGFDPKKVREDLDLQPGELFSRETLNDDVAEIRKALREEKFLAPELEEPLVEHDPKTNTVDITLKGKVGAVVNITVEGGEKKIGEKTQTRLLTVKREGTLDYAAIIEGERRLRNYYQEQGYFFADVKAICSVKPEFSPEEIGITTSESDVLCSALSGPSLKDRVIDIKYQTNLGRRLKLVDIRLEGTDKISIADIQGVLKSQEKSLLGVIPYLGYGRGYTSNEILEDDRRTVQSLVRELGYRRAEVTARQGVSPNGEDLIITFVVNEGVPTRIDGVDIAGNTAFSDDTLLAKVPSLVGKNFSRARARNGVKEIAKFYSQEGFYEAKVSYSLVELDEGENAPEELVKVVYNLENEGKKTFVNRILINGNEMTDREAILKAINLRVGEVLRANDIFTSEQNLYSTDAFSLVEIKAEQAGERADGSAIRDI
ncbi:MAG: POTRA domain-containing protein, partial [Pyrinomonadaceae bacterium]